MKKFKIKEEGEISRIDKFLSVKLKDISRSQIQKLIKQEFITVNDSAVSAHHKLKIDDVINNVDKISNNIQDVTTSFKNTLTKDKIEQITNELYSTMEKIKSVVHNLNIQINESRLPGTFAAARILMETTVKQLDGAIVNFNSTAKSVKNLSDELDSNPSALIWGSDKEKVVPSY